MKLGNQEKYLINDPVLKIYPNKTELINIESTKEPRLPDIVLFGLIFVNFGPLNILPNKIPPISDEIQINKIINKIILK